MCYPGFFTPRTFLFWLRWFLDVWRHSYREVVPPLPGPAAERTINWVFWDSLSLPSSVAGTDPNLSLGSTQVKALQETEEVLSGSHLQLKGGKNLSAERRSLERKKWCSYGGQLKYSAWGYSLEKKKSIKQTRRSVRENFYFNSQLWDCASDHVHQKGDVLHAEFPDAVWKENTIG
ncbi:uncharacterized protein LJ206_005110 isoform 1-T1 [Theristicus caerulescens]